MRLVLCAFALGVVLLQQQPTLPGTLAWCLGAISFAALVAAGCAVDTLCRRRHPWGETSRGVLGAMRSAAPLAAFAAFAAAAALAGYGYAAWRADLRMRDALPEALEGRELVLVGHVRGLPVRERSHVRFVLAVDVEDARRRTGLPHFPRRVQLSWPQRAGLAPPLVPGDRWQLTVRLKRAYGNANPGGRDAQAAFFARGVRAAGAVVAPSAARRLAGGEGGLPSAIDRRRMALAERIDAVLGKAAHRGIVTALAIGAQEAIGAEDRAALRRTGTSHLVAISGLHIGLVAGIAAGVSAWLWRRSCLIGRFLARRSALEWPLVVPVPLVAVLAGTLCAAFYAALAGFNVPAQRAFWMLCVVAAAFALGRNVVPSVVLAWAAALVLLVDPWAVLGPGFWLSFGAVAVISFALQTRMRSARAGELAGACGFDADDMGDGARTDGEWWRRWCLLARRHAATMRERIATACHAQYAVTIGLAPLTAYWFSEVPLLGPAANALAVPWVSALVTPLVIVAVILPAPLDAAAFELAHTLLAPLMRLLQRLAEPAWAQWRIARPSVWAMALAALGVVWVLMPRGWPLRIAAPLAWLPLVWPVPSGPPHGAFRLTALDVGQGSAILVETARHALLFDAGPGPESTHAGERIVAPYLRANGVPVLDAIVVSHGDADHAGGVPAVLADAQVLQLMGGLPPESTLWREARAWGADALRCVAGQRWRWDGVDFSVLWPEAGPLPGKANAQSCVLKVEAAGGRALLTGDIDAAVERRLVARASDALKAEVLIVAHHGSKTSSTELFLDSVKPRIAVFQVGYRNRFGHPHPAVWSRFAARGIELARTDRDGAVRVEVAPHGPTLERHRDTHRRYWMEGRENETNEAGRVPRRSSEPGGSQA